MSRTYRKQYHSFQHNQIQPFAACQKELLEEFYTPLTRHSSRSYPHYSSTWDDKYPSSSKDKFCRLSRANFYKHF